MGLFNHSITKNIHGLLIIGASCALLNSTAYAEQSNKYIKAPVSSINKVQNPQTISGGANAETGDKAEQRLPTTLQHRDRAVSKKNYKSLVNKPSGGTINTQSRSPIKTTQNQLKKQDSKTISKQSEQSNLDYESLKSESKTRIPKHTPQWGDQRNHDPGKTLLNPQISNKQFEKSIKSNLPSIDQPVLVKPDSKGYKVSSEPGDTQFGDVNRGSRLPSSTSSKSPSYKTGSKTSVIETSE